ncbi:glutamate receptor ionotropic, kainate 2 isoform X3 [Anabrus simplex]|uniref:glutamate receptor ionotropic, kainate 2 isoform X3 n=1 Tax=Anabrus simplex TaxID=316456 RepID=UPI0034DCDECC
MAVGALVWFAVLVGVVGTRSDRLRIVAFQNPEDGLHRDIAFRYAVQHMNNDLRHPDILDLEMRNVKPFDSFGTGLITCDLAAKGLAGVFGPQSASSTGIVRSICEKLEIPHVITIWEPNAVITQHTNNLYPDAEVFSQALAEVVLQMKWRSYTVLYQDDSALIRLQGVLQNSDKGDNPIIVRQLDPGKDYRPMLKEIKMSTETRIILDCDPEDILDILRAADSVDMMDVYCSYLITSLDGHTVDYSEFSDGPNITTLRIVDPTSPVVENAVRDWIDGEKRSNRDLNLTPDTVKTETALTYDAVLLYTEAVVLLNTTGHITQEPLECRGSRRWTKGLGISNFMRLRQIEGMTGLIELDTNGRRTSFSVDLVEYTSKGFQKVGVWNPIDRFVSTRSRIELETQIAGVLGRKLMIVSSKLGPPYLMERNQTDPPTLFGNDRYEGFSLDLIDEIARELKFKYEFRLVPDQKHGTQDQKTGEWNGLMGELLNRRADLAICDLTITYEREKAVDFTMPFMNLGISILYKKTGKSETNLFSFLEPFSFDVWIYMATAYLGVSVILFVLSRISPYEWVSKHPCQAEPSELVNSLSMKNSIWHNCGSLMQQGSDIAPQAVSTRMVAGMWWFFTLIMISSYTANLAAFLTVAKMEEEIKGVDDLAKQTKIKYGTYKHGSTARFFQTSNVSLYQRIWSVMQQTRPDVFTDDNTQGVDRVRNSKGNYAFFMESTSIEYQMERDCDLMKIGGELDSKGYGIAMPPGSPYRIKMNEAILKLQEAGRLKLLKTRWWKEKGGGKCDSEEKDDETDSNKLGLPNVGGVFLVLFFGCAAAFFVSVLEFLWNCRKIAVQEKITPWEAIVSELKFAMTCNADSKPVMRKPPETDMEMMEGGSFLEMNYDKYDIGPN